MNSGSLFESSHPHTRPPHRPGFSSVFPRPSHGPSRVQPASTRPPEQIRVSHSHADSHWPKRRDLRIDARANAFPGFCAGAFKVVFVLCFVLFLRALSGAGVRVSRIPGCKQGCDVRPATTYSQPVCGGSNAVERDGGDVMWNPRHVQHDYLAVDPDGQYSYTSGEIGAHRVGYRWTWGKTNVKNVMFVQDEAYARAGADMDVDRIHSPKSTSDMVKDAASASHTPESIPSTFIPRNSESAFQNYPAAQNGNGDPEVLRDSYSEAERKEHETDEDLDVHLFFTGDHVPVHSPHHASTCPRFPTQEITSVRKLEPDGGESKERSRSSRCIWFQLDG